MDKKEEDGKSKSPLNMGVVKETNNVKSKAKNRGKKRKRRNSESASSEDEDILPDNSVEVDRSLHASAIKNNLDETSVRKIIKKVVTNDRVLALVKMREEEDSGLDENSLRPKLTRAKAKELMKVSPKAGAWNLENLELTPIKHIPVKTRPEVKALIAQELPEDEDDEEYEPTNDDVPSDDDQGLESCSDLDSQPRTPATPRSQHSISPKVVKDGPFKVPQDVSTPTRRKLDLEEEATIALRTRSKLSLSSTSIEHIESTFVPPDDIPMTDVDDLWNQFLNECLNPASTSKNEDDDETDPEYNVAADPDAHDEDEESLGNSIIKISKKELNDLVTELFNIMPEPTVEEQLMADNLANSVLTNQSRSEVSTRWEGKQEPLSDDESEKTKSLPDRITFEKKNYSRVSIGKTEAANSEEARPNATPNATSNATPAQEKKDSNKENLKFVEIREKPAPMVKVSVVEQEGTISIENAPPLLQGHLKPALRRECVHIVVSEASCVLPEQVQLIQQQLRQHIQLATSSFLQLYVHPIHWSYASKYKEYLETFWKLVESKPKSVANVCNLKPAIELITTWEKTMSADTPENKAMIDFILKESHRCSRRSSQKNLYVGEFHDTFKKVVANSPVFLYPYLLPSMPFRGENPRRFCYLHSEDELIALGLEQFWKYVTDNPEIYKPMAHLQNRWGLGVTLELVVKHMFPWIPVKVLHSHIHIARKDKENPISKYFKYRTVTPVQHKLLPYNPKLTLYEQPAHEVPRIWVRYLAKTSKRFRSHLQKRTDRTGVPPRGVDIELGQAVAEPSKPGLPIDFMDQIAINRKTNKAPDKFDIQLAHPQPIVSNLFRFVDNGTEGYLVPIAPVTITVNSNSGLITTPISTSTNSIPTQNQVNQNSEHCPCCVILRKICKQRQSLITDYFSKAKTDKLCDCGRKRYPKVSKRLFLLVNNYKYSYKNELETLMRKIEELNQAKNGLKTDTCDNSFNDEHLDDLVHVTKFQLKLLARTAISVSTNKRRTIYNLLANFNPVEEDPLELASQLEKTLGNELKDLYKEFLGFLTPEQADKLYLFKDYFTRNCVTDLIKNVEEQVTDTKKRERILEAIHKVFTNNQSTACEICASILSTLHGYPTLAQYVHSLFPHRRIQNSFDQYISVVQEQEKPQSADKPANQTASNTTVCEESAIDYEADQSMSEDEENGGDKSNSESETTENIHRPIKMENITAEEITPTSERMSVVVTVSKTEEQDFNECSNSSLKIVLEDGIIKLETPDWKRDEDKFVLEVLKQQLTPEERNEKSILEIIEEKNIAGMISETLTHKSESDIKTRILYLLQIC